ncbi:hypothetical protein ACFODO_20615 [Acinetobacter sichuanensis]|uniref:Lipoprotein n=1 Tax=Acinetobacter sichuanensis TaxID=2136183 RepID=A0A371YJH1_9GAMM|nr:hypothetical protein [Acinetobacter sichuanensis]RFC81617.1 hypothetical protein C9E89_020910 [Acinetobacter sichuanensis]
MKNIFWVGVFCFGLALGGCATPKHNYQATPQNISKPPIGSTNEAFVGDKMLEQGVFLEREALYVPTTFKHSGYTISEGYYLKTGEDKKGHYFKPLNMIPNGGNVQKSFINDPFQAVMLNVENQICIVTTLNLRSCSKEEHSAKLSTVGIATDNSFQQTLIYSGKVGNKINIGYREFSSNLARPAFNNDVEYDLSESKQIGYKGALLEIEDANNQSIKYKVLKNFNKVE